MSSVKYQIGHHPGATWKKCDFQVHTPRDTQWDGPSFEGASASGIAARKSWAKDLIRAAVAKQLRAIAITDHHDIAFVPIVLEALAELQAIKEAENFWVFPGMEVTCDDNSQCLALFDPNTSIVELERLYGGLLKDVARPNYQLARMPQADICGQNVASFVQALTEDIILGTKCIVLPHAGDPGNSHKSVLASGFKSRFRELSCEGVYIECSHADLGVKSKKKIYGEIKEWGRRRRGIVSTGDNRKADFSDLGSHPCWVRLGEPSAEAIRQAVLADEARIAYAEPALPTYRVLSLEVNSTLCGPGLSLSINDGFNAIIGGRGSGKSAILEYLRFALGRSALDLPSDSDEQERFRSLLEDTLQDGFVKLSVIREGVREEWTRTLANSGTIEVTRDDGTSEAITAETAQQRFAARAFHQKELSTVVSLRRPAIDQITGIAAAELLEERRANDNAREAAALRLSTAFQELVEFWNAETALERAQAAVEDLQRRTAVNQEQLRSAGLSEEAQNVLKAASDYARAKEFLNDAAGVAEETEGRLRGFRKNLLGNLDIPILPDNPDFDDLRALASEIEQSKGEMGGRLSEAIELLGRLRGRITKGDEEFSKRNVAFQTRLQSALAQQKQHKALLDTAADLNRNLEGGSKNARVAKERVASLAAARTTFAAARTAYDSLVSQRAELLSRAATHATEMSGQRLVAVVQSASPSEAQVQALVGVVEASRIRNVEEQTRHFLDSQSDLTKSWSRLVDSLVELCRIKTRAVHSGEVSQVGPDIQARIGEDLPFENITPHAAQQIWNRLGPDVVIAALRAVADAYITFQYKDQDGSYIPFERASPGQQAAALLMLLLNQKAGTLIIDQPEDDLDNRVVMDIAKLLRTTKQNRQLIFATHNANFVVNGDADKVIVMGANALDPSQGSVVGPRVAIQIDGAIESDAVRDGITDIMEGGKNAFELRRRKYDIERDVI